MQLLYPILSLLLLLLNAQQTLGARSAATSFCKCVCFNNSTIIALNPPSTGSSANRNSLLLHRSPSAAEGDDENNNTGNDDTPPAKTPSHHKLTCADCNRAFCLDYRLPICEGAKEKDVFTTCFQRDSIKDETVVIIFLFATTGLLGWALVRPWIEKLRDTRSYDPVSTGSAPYASSSLSSSNRRARSTRTRGESDAADVDDDTGHGSRTIP